jgi:hypothetical protein
MQALVGLSDNAAAAVIPGSAFLPGPVNILIHLMNRVHWVWRWNFMLTQVVANTNNLQKYIAGNLLNLCLNTIVPDKLALIIRIAAQVTLAAARIVELGKQKMRTFYALRDLYYAIAMRQPLRIRVKMPRDKHSLIFHLAVQRLLGPDNFVWALKKKEAVIQYVSRIARCTFELLRHMFVTSMCYMDVIEVFTLNPEAKHDAVNQVFMSASRLLDDISKNKQHIHAELLRNQRLIEKILSGLGNPCRADQLISAVSMSLTVTEKTYNTAGWVWDNTKDVVKQAYCGGMLGIFGPAVPRALLPRWVIPDEQNPIGPLPQ